ncbi:MAG: hypothetical protein WCG86_03005 [Actinomycetota bacterium]|jgi:protein-tyrosine-phosphatase
MSNQLETSPVPTKFVTLCTGNAARSVMLGYMLNTLTDTHDLGWEIRTAGTHAAEGLAMSPRTLTALESISELGEHHYTAHRSHQLSAEDAEWADVIVAVEADHVNYVRGNFPAASDKVIQLRHFVRFAPLDSGPTDQMAAVRQRPVDPSFDVRDPAGGDQAQYDACASELWELSQIYVTLVATEAFD